MYVLILENCMDLFSLQRYLIYIDTHGITDFEDRQKAEIGWVAIFISGNRDFIKTMVTCKVLIVLRNKFPVNPDSFWNIVNELVH